MLTGSDADMKTMAEEEITVAKKQLLDIVAQMMIRDRIDALILGCTEFPIMFTNEQYLFRCKRCHQ